MKITILTLTTQRDKFIDKMLAEELNKLGHDARVRNYINAGRETVTYEKPDVVIHPMPGGQYKLDFIQLCKKWGVEVIVRRGEAGMGREQFEKLDDNRKGVILGNWDYSPYVDLELTWGKEFTGILAEQGYMPAEKLKACGAFAFDPYFVDIPTVVKPPRQKTILFATGFSTADCRSEYCETGLPEDSGYHEEIYSIHRAARDEWIEAIKELVKWFGDDWAFELKVRPGEQTEEYRAKLSKEVKIHPQESASSEILRNVDVLIHSGSTLAVEAHLLGIPSFNFHNVNPDPLLSKISPILTTYRELEFYIARAIHGSNIHEDVYFELENHLYGHIDGKACERAARHIHDHIEGKEIKTDIPDVWPKTAKYHEDKENIHLKSKKGDVRWLCPCCRNVYYAKSGGITRCPYCSMNIEMTSKTKGVGRSVAK